MKNTAITILFLMFASCSGVSMIKPDRKLAEKVDTSKLYKQTFLQKMSEIKDYDIKGIKTKIDELRVDIFNLRMKKKTTGLEKPHLVGVIRRNLARLLMVLGEKAKEVK